jgi:hypothetical protein
LCHKSRVKKKWLFRSVFCAVLSVSGLCGPASAQGGATFALHSLSIAGQDGEPRLEASVAVNNMDALRAGLEGGAPVNLEFRLNLEQIRFVLPDRKIDESSQLHQLRFDPLTREYLLLSRGSPPLRQRRLEDLLGPALADLVFPLAPPGGLKPDVPYRVNLTIAARYAQVPPWLKRTLFFWSWDVIAPVTFSLDFTLPGPAYRGEREAEGA